MGLYFFFIKRFPVLPISYKHFNKMIKHHHQGCITSHVQPSEVPNVAHLQPAHSRMALTRTVIPTTQLNTVSIITHAGGRGSDIRLLN